MFKDTKGIIRSRKSIYKQYNGQKKKNKRIINQSVYKTQHRKLKLEKHEPDK